ncbi:11431_t:CDS:2, partial [Dentiscutata heterogama]
RISVKSNLDKNVNFVRIITDKTIALGVELFHSSEDVKKEIFISVNISSDQQHLIFVGRQLEDFHTLPWNDNAPCWRQAVDDLNFECRCFIFLDKIEIK